MQENATHFRPIDNMRQRIEDAREDTDLSLGMELLYLGEMVTKIVASGLIASIEDDPQRYRYSQLYRLVRSDGLGDWATVIDDVLKGPPAQYLTAEIQKEQRELIQKSSEGTWQYEAVELLNDCLALIDASVDRQTKVQAHLWFSLFARLRNKTRGHGVIANSIWSKLCPKLERSIQIIIDNFNLFKRPWAYLHRNLSGKYRVIKWTEAAKLLEPLKSIRTISIDNGVYICLSPEFKGDNTDNIVKVELIASDVDANDFYFPNGGFDDKKYELISYVSGNKQLAQAKPYLSPATELPASETQGLGSLELQGDCFGNLPPIPTSYINRENLEKELYEALLNDRHPIITLIGSGGIGKTWLTLSVLHELTKAKQYNVALWFSARDIDLTQAGPKIVQPQILTQVDIAQLFVELVFPQKKTEKGFKPVEFFAEMLGSTTKDGPFLFVFDNFETVRSPTTLYTWLDNYIRLPNKILITTRFRDFKGDYPVEVHGMNENEFGKLAASTAQKLSISRFLTKEYLHQLYQESDGHPYVAKVLLGEVAKSGKLLGVERIIATKDDLLNALFERTYSGLSPIAQKVFLTLCSWRSVIPQIAVEAVLLRSADERVDIAEAVEELQRSSFIEAIPSADEKEIFLSVPLVAAVFGGRKLAVSPLKTLIEDDVVILRMFGATQQTGISHGLAPRINKMFSEVANKVNQNSSVLEIYVPILEFVARKYPRAWILLADLYEETDLDDRLLKSKSSISRYLEAPEDNLDAQEEAWEKLVLLCRQTDDHVGEAQALLEKSKLPDISFIQISDSANRLNALFKTTYDWDTIERQSFAKKMIEIMLQHSNEAKATDYSRIAWLFIHLKDLNAALYYARKGLDLETDNLHCINLVDRLTA